MLISDETEAYIGSANITTTSLNTNLELGVKTNKDIGQLIKIFNSVWDNSRIIDLKELL